MSALHRGLALALLAPLLTTAAPARAWELFRSESSAVERGNEHLGKKENKEALEAYDEAATELPNDPAVQLNRGLALLGLEKLGPAREAFRRAGSGSAPKEVRAPALYNLGIGFLQEADGASKAEDFDGARKLLEESVDAFKGSLRAQPNNPDAAWNLELAKRRLVDAKQKQEQKKKEQDEKEKEKEKDKQNKDKENEDDPQKGDDPSKPDPSQGDAGTEQPDAGAPDPAEGGTPKDDDGAGEPDAGAPEPEPSEADGGAAPEPQPSQPPEAKEGQLPEHMERALDALEAGEENLEKHRARQRARTKPRRIEKDW